MSRNARFTKPKLTTSGVGDPDDEERPRDADRADEHSADEDAERDRRPGARPDGAEDAPAEASWDDLGQHREEQRVDRAGGETRRSPSAASATGSGGAVAIVRYMSGIRAKQHDEEPPARQPVADRAVGERAQQRAAAEDAEHEPEVGGAPVCLLREDRHDDREGRVEQVRAQHREDDRAQHPLVPDEAHALRELRRGSGRAPSLPPRARAGERGSATSAAETRKLAESSQRAFVAPSVATMRPPMRGAEEHRELAGCRSGYRSRAPSARRRARRGRAGLPPVRLPPARPGARRGTRARRAARARCRRSSGGGGSPRRLRRSPGRRRRSSCGTRGGPRSHRRRTPRGRCGTKLKKTASAVRVALPVVVRTNHGIASCAAAFPVSEIASAT